MEELAAKKAVTYSLLAHIKNSGSLTDGPLAVFIPLVKKGIHHMNLNKDIYKGESINEIREVIESIYGIDIPLPTLIEILIKISQELNSGQEKDIFVLNKDNSFWIKDYIFDDFDDEIEKSKNEIQTLQEIFEEFCNIHSIKSIENESIVKFIEKNKIAISGYLANRNKDNGNDYVVVAQFIDYFKKIPAVYAQIRNLYLGSILTCYLEFTPQQANLDVTLLLDTNFIISLLDLNTPDSTHTCKKLLEVCRKMGYRFEILKDTIEETQGLLRFKAENYDSAIVLKYVNREDIYNACERRSLNKVDLDRIADNLEESLLLKDIKIIPHTETLKNKARYSSEYKALKPYRNTDRSALHDAMAIIYVKEKRGKRIKEFEKVNYWFVNNSNSHDSDKEGIDTLINSGNNDYQPEIIKADSLLNILWLTNPSINTEIANSELVDIGLTSLVAFTLNDSLPKSRIIRELDDNIQKYSKDGELTDRDVLLLSSRIVNRQLKNIESLNKLADTNRAKFIEKIKDEAQKQDVAETERVEKLEILFKSLAAKIEDFDHKKAEIKEQSQYEILEAKKEINLLERENNKEISRLKAELLKKDNEQRERLREEFIEQRIKKWRGKTKIWFYFCFGLLLLAIVWLIIACNGNIDVMDAMVQRLINNKVIAIIGSAIIALINLFIIRQYYDKYHNHSNIESFKKSIKIPKEFLPLDYDIT